MENLKFDIDPAIDSRFGDIITDAYKAEDLDYDLGDLTDLLLKSNNGKIIPSITFNFLESNIGRTILYYKNNVNLIVQIKENIWNNKKNLQLMVIDMITDLNKA